MRVSSTSANDVCTIALLMELGLGRVKATPFDEEEIRALKGEIISCLTGSGLELKKENGDRKDVQIDFRFLDLLLRAAEDPEVGLGQFALGVRPDATRPSTVPTQEDVEAGASQADPQD